MKFGKPAESWIGVRFDSLWADAIFGWRQITKKRTTSAAAILSLALAIGACMSAFRIIDALLLRPLPVSQPEKLYALSRQQFAVRGTLTTYDGWEYRLFRQLRAAVKGQAELVALSFVDRGDLTYRSDQDMEKAHLQYVSGRMFQSFGLSPAAGRFFTEADDREGGARPVAVLSYDYWSRRFGRDPKVIGRTFRLGSNQGQAKPGDVYEIIGIGPEKFSGTEPGRVTDIFLPTAMNGYANLPIAAFLRIFVRLEPGVAPDQIRQRLQATYQHLQEEEAKRVSTGGQHRWSVRLHRLLMVSAAAGISGMQKDYRLPLTALGVLVCLVLLIACANLANLMTAQAAARGREMALRIAIGAGRWRLVQMVLVESAILAASATVIGALFAWWSTPFVVGRINPPDNPVRLLLPWDWRVLLLGLALTLAVTCLFGLAPALRASAIRPANALKGGEDPHARRRLVHGLITTQIVFCFLVLFVGSLFIATFARLSNQPTGFSAERLLTLDTVAQHAPAVAWEQVADHLRTVPGVERVALAEWALMDGWGHKGSSVSINGALPTLDVGASFLSVSPEWLDTMRIPLLAGRNFRASDIYLNAQKSGVAIVNQTFARQYFNGENPIGKAFDTTTGGLQSAHFRIVGVVGDARYWNMRDPIPPVVYNPFHWADGVTWARLIDRATFIVKTSNANPLTLASVLRREVSRARPDFYVRDIRTQEELVQMHMVRERMLAALALFFAAVALLIAGVGMYGVLDYSVLQQTREIGIRMALGAHAGNIAQRVILGLLGRVGMGAVTGCVVGMVSERYVESILYHVNATDPIVVTIPALTILAAALLAALPPLIRAVRIDPATVLRAE